MTQTIEAIYQNGMFKPIVPVSEKLSEGETVELIVKNKRLSPEEMLELASQVYEGLSEEDIDEIERIALEPEKKKPKYTLEELLDGITEENLHGEIDFGKPSGKEIW